jgi:hypothetical protein
MIGPAMFAMARLLDSILIQDRIKVSDNRPDHSRGPSMHSAAA